MEILKRPLISHLLCLAVGLGLGIFLSRANHSGSLQDENQNTISTDGAGTGGAGVDGSRNSGQGSAADGSAGSGTGSGTGAGGLPGKEALDASSALLKMREDYDGQIRRGETRQALLILQEMEKKAPKSQIYLETNSEYLVHMKDWRAAAAAANSCVAVFPKSRTCYRNLATAEIQDGASEEQAAAVDACLALEPNDPQCRNMLGTVQMNGGDYSGAIATFERLIRDNGSFGVRFPDDHLEYQLGLALEGAGRTDEAIDHLENACRRNNNPACKKIEEISGGGFD